MSHPSKSSMKDSGIEWIGSVPDHWNVVRTRFVARLESGHTPSRSKPEYWLDCTIPWVTLADVWQLRDGTQKMISETKEHVSDLGLANSSARLLPARTVIVSRTASVGFVGMMAEPMATTQDFVNWVCGSKIRPDFLYWVFRGMEQEFRRLMTGSTHKTIYMPDVERFCTPLPPIQEQDVIAQYLDRKTHALNRLIKGVGQARGEDSNGIMSDLFGKLLEYRSSLIHHVVTGKVRPTEGECDGKVCEEATATNARQ